MDHGHYTFDELAKKDAICSVEVKKALDINSTYDEDLKKGLSCLQKERRSFMSSLTKQKQDFVQRTSKLPSIHLARSGHGRAKIQKKVTDICCNAWLNDDSNRRNGSPVMEVRSGSRASSRETNKLFREKSNISDRGSMKSEDDGLLDGAESPPLTNWHSKTSKDMERTSKLPREENGSGKLTSQALDVVPPRSPTLLRAYLSNTPDSNEDIELAQSRSLPSSPRTSR